MKHRKKSEPKAVFFGSYQNSHKSNKIKNFVKPKKFLQLKKLLIENLMGENEPLVMEKRLNIEICQNHRHIFAIPLHRDSDARNKNNDFPIEYSSTSTKLSSEMYMKKMNIVILEKF